MKIGIIVYSQTGNTLSVAQKLKNKLSTAGHTVSLHQVSAFNGGESDVSKIRLNSAPSTEPYDALLFGAPVQGFSLSPVMAAYLSQATALQEKKVACFMTQFFPHPSMGGNRAIQQMRSLCETKGAKIHGSGIVNWSHPCREKRVADTVDTLCRLF